MYKIDILLKQDQKLFHTNDLALLWQIKNNNTLYTTIKRYVQKGILIPIHKGFYSTIPLDKIDPVRLGMGYLHTYCYFTCESILSLHGVIFQVSPYITLVSSVSKKFTLSGYSYLVRKMKDSLLYNNLGIVAQDGIAVSSLERAVADILYFNPRYHIDDRKAVNWRKVKEIQKKVGFV